MQVGKPGVATPGPGSHYNSQVPEREGGRPAAEAIKRRQESVGPPYARCPE